MQRHGSRQTSPRRVGPHARRCTRGQAQCELRVRHRDDARQHHFVPVSQRVQGGQMRRCPSQDPRPRGLGSPDVIVLSSDRTPQRGVRWSPVRRWLQPESAHDQTTHIDTGHGAGRGRTAGEHGRPDAARHDAAPASSTGDRTRRGPDWGAPADARPSPRASRGCVGRQARPANLRGGRRRPIGPGSHPQRRW
jgi:hypothetical protein